MHSVATVVLPIFALIMLGFVCRKTNRLGEKSASELNRVVVWLCLPALLFKVTANSTWQQIWQPGFVLSFTLGCMLVFAATLCWRLYHGQTLVVASIDGLAASYANTGYIGIPLCLLVFGQDGLQPALIASLVVVCALFSVSIVCIEVGLQSQKNVASAVYSVVSALSKNPLVVAPIAGGCWAASGLGIATPVEHLLDMLATATTPCALISLGAFLAQKQPQSQQTVWPLVLMKLLGQPMLTAWLAFKVFNLPSLWAHSALLLSALPTGTGPFMLAEHYGREAAMASRTILLTTLGSIATLSLCLYWLGA